MIIRLLSGIYAAGVLISIIGICQQLFLLDIIPQSAEPAATLANTNMAAEFITLTLPLGIVLHRKWVAILCSIPMFVFLYFTTCIAAWVAVGCEIVLIACILNIRNRNKVLFLFIGAMLLFSGTFIGQRINTISVQARLNMSANTIEMIKDKPLGYGPGNFKVFYPKYQKYNVGVTDGHFNELTQVIRAHNDPLQLIAETGLIGGIVLLLIVVLFFIGIVRVLCKENDKFYIALGVGAATMGILINSCFSFPFYLPVPPLFVAVYLAIGLSLFNAPTIQFNRVVAPMFIVLLVPLFIYLFQYQYNTIQQSRYHLYAKHFDSKENWKAALIIANKAYLLNKHNKKMLLFIGTAQLKLGNTYKGIEALQEVVKAYPYNMNPLLNLGVGYGRVNQEDKAIECFNKVLDIKPDNAKAYINIAVTRLKLNQNELAVMAFNKAKAIKPEYFK